MLHRKKSIHSHSRPKLRLKLSNNENQKGCDNPKGPLITIKHIQPNKTPFKVRKIQRSNSKGQCRSKQRSNTQIVHKTDMSRVISRKKISEKEENYFPETLLPQKVDIQNISDPLIIKLIQKQMLRDMNGRYFIKREDFLFLIKAMFADEYLPEVKLNKIIQKLQNYQSEPDAALKTIKQITKKQNMFQIENVYSLTWNFSNSEESDNQIICPGNHLPSISHIVKDQQRDYYRKKPKMVTHKNVTFIQMQDNQEQFCIKEESIGIQFCGEDKLFGLMNITDLQTFKNKHQQLLYTYINSQDDDYAKRCLQQYKNLQEDMLCYSDLLQNRPKQVSVVNKAIPSINRLIDSHLQKAINRLSDKSMNESQKIDLTKQTINTIRKQYSGLVKQLSQVIKEKSQHVKQFQRKVIKWWDIHVFRKQFLTKMKHDYCSELFNLFSTLKYFFLNVNEFPSLRKNIEHLMVYLVEGIKKMDECVMLGNNFY